ncbi:hypothetical protein SAMN05216228_103716 [Rhizobium tibeticum]|uniref:Uncharacterized protein n=1 Tax=Rhizobium tibeticum TaxID=501024 RepID=A0A1H8UX91_9HYPH|nr:hypothetical protein RTCCBAU85039_5777 [Rhizobium tibeticum]SEP07795.1 hypothetical protein SAMN05216228_103716 [Rhizobium tibeticum]
MPKTLSAAVHELYTLHGLFELSIESRQRYQWIELEFTHSVKNGERDLHQKARLYWSLCNERVEEDSETSRMDVLLAPDRRPEEFTRVTAGWMDSAHIMADPRARFARLFSGHTGSIASSALPTCSICYQRAERPKRRNLMSF